MVRAARWLMICVVCIVPVLVFAGCAGTKHVGHVGKLELSAERDGDLVLRISRGGEYAEHHLDDAEAEDMVRELEYLLAWDEKRKPSEDTIERDVWDYGDFRGRYVAAPDRVGSYLILEWGEELDWFNYGIVTLNKKQIQKFIEVLDKTELKYSQSVS